MSRREQDIERQLFILHTQVDVLTQFVGYLASYTVSDNEFEHVKRFISDNVKKCNTPTPNESQQDALGRIVSERTWSQILDQLD